MPEVHFTLRWPDGTRETGYSPSTIVRQYWVAGTEYGLEDFLGRSRAALGAASERVRTRYGMPCALALGQLARIEAAASRFSGHADARVLFEQFKE